MDLGAALRPVERLAAGGPRPPSVDARPAAAKSAISYWQQSTWLVPALAAVLTLFWLVAVFSSDRAHFLLISNSVGMALFAAFTIGRLTAAAVLLVYPDERFAPALRWIGLGFLFQGIGSVTISRLLPAVFEQLDPRRLSYGLTTVWLLSGICWLTGFVPSNPPRLSPLRAASIVTLGVITCLAVSAIATHFPRMFPRVVSDAALTSRTAPLQNLSIWHWLTSSVPLLLTIAAAALIYRRFPASGLRASLLVGFALLGGAVLHRTIWPGDFAAAATPTNLLGLSGLLVITAGGFTDLRRIAAERANHLAAVRTRANELGIVVAHELGSPIAAIRGLVDILVLPDLDPAVRTRALATIRGETAVLSVLAEDIQTLGGVEHHLLSVTPFPVDLGLLIGDAVGFARVLPGDHPIKWPQTLTGRVIADPERISQVFRNLLTNASKYSPPGSQIEIKAKRHGDHLRVAVVDRGPGINPSDSTRIFEKFDRGCHMNSAIPGTGIGLYIARELVRAHGTDLTVEPTPGGGATFAFDLEIAR